MLIYGENHPKKGECWMKKGSCRTKNAHYNFKNGYLGNGFFADATKKAGNVVPLVLNVATPFARTMCIGMSRADKFCHLFHKFS